MKRLIKPINVTFTHSGTDITIKAMRKIRSQDVIVPYSEDLFTKEGFDLIIYKRDKDKMSKEDEIKKIENIDYSGDRKLVIKDIVPYVSNNNGIYQFYVLKLDTKKVMSI